MVQSYMKLDIWDFRPGHKKKNAIPLVRRAYFDLKGYVPYGYSSRSPSDGLGESSVRCNCLGWESLPKAKVAEWQTRWTQNPVSLTDVWVRLPPLVLYLSYPILFGCN
jgi:hypothetical protein